MPTKAKMLPGYVYLTAIVRNEDFPILKAYAKRIHLPVTQAIAQIIGASGPHLSALADAQEEAEAAKMRELAYSLDPLVNAVRQQRRRRRAPALTNDVP